MTEAVDLFNRRGWLDDPAEYFPHPPPAAPLVIQHTRLLGGLRFERFRFESGYDPDPDESGQARWLAHRAQEPT